MCKQRRQSGFTLMELIIVIGLLAIMMAIIVPKVKDNMDTSAAVEAKKDADSVMNIAQVYLISLSDSLLYDENYLDKKLSPIISGSSAGTVKYTKNSALPSNSYRYMSRGTPPKLNIDMNIVRNGLTFKSTIIPDEKKIKIECSGDSRRCSKLNKAGLVD